MKKQLIRTIPLNSELRRDVREVVCDIQSNKTVTFNAALMRSVKRVLSDSECHTGEEIAKKLKVSVTGVYQILNALLNEQMVYVNGYKERSRTWKLCSIEGVVTNNPFLWKTYIQPIKPSVRAYA